MGRNGTLACWLRLPGAEAQAHAPNEITWKQDLCNMCRCICIVTIRIL